MVNMFQLLLFKSVLCEEEKKNARAVSIELCVHLSFNNQTQMKFAAFHING